MPFFRRRQRCADTGAIGAPASGATCEKVESGATGVAGASVLSALRSGAKGEVCDICAGCKARTRLASLGLIAGSPLRVVSNPGFGPLLLSVGESRIMVERGVADKVQVQVA